MTTYPSFSSQIEDSGGGAVLAFRVVPRASDTRIVQDGEILKFRLAAPPVEGAANAELVRFLSKLFGITKSDVSIISGQRSKNKRILLRGLAAVRVREILAEYLQK